MLLGNIYVSGWKRAQKKFSTVYGFWKSYRRKFVRHLIKRQNIKRVKRSANYQFFSLGAAHLWSLQKRTWSGNRTRTRTGLRNTIWANTRISILRKHKFHVVFVMVLSYFSTHFPLWGHFPYVVQCTLPLVLDWRPYNKPLQLPARQSSKRTPQGHQGKASWQRCCSSWWAQAWSCWRPALPFPTLGGPLH